MPIVSDGIGSAGMGCNFYCFTPVWPYVAVKNLIYLES